MYNKNKHIHFIGIGGIGMSGIAALLKKRGYTVSGCDTNQQQRSMLELLALGVTLYHGSSHKQCDALSPNILVYSTAITPTHPERIAAQQQNILTIHRSQLLAQFMNTPSSIAITGTHGKTTTTALASHIFIEAGKKPTCIIGGHVTNLGTNYYNGSSDIVIAEADESDRSLLNLNPTTAIITNIDLEHLETYKNIEDIKKTFVQFLDTIPAHGQAILCADDTNIQSLLPLNNTQTLTYGFSTNADMQAHTIQLQSHKSVFSVYINKDKKNLGTITTTLLGKHNILNILAAITVAQTYGIDFNVIQKAIQSFAGIERRFTFRGIFQGAEVFDDYGHHPQEIYHTLQVARNRARNKLIVVFQPHRYTRTQALWNDFLVLFEKNSVDHLFITDIYPASEKPISGITSFDFVQDLKKLHPTCNVTYIPWDSSCSALKNSLQAIANIDDLILSVGAGSITNLSTQIL